MKRLVFGLAAALFCTPAQAQALPPLAEQAVQLRRAHAFLDRCKGEAWMSAVFNAEFTRTLAQIAIQMPAAVSATNVAATRAEASDAATACDSPAGKAFGQQVAEAADAVGADWVMRMAAMLTVSGTEPWGGEITTLDPHGEAIIARMTQLKIKDAELFAKARAQSMNEARIALRLVCPDRRTVRSFGPRPCPDVPAEDRSSAPIATALVVGAERIAPLLPYPKESAAMAPTAYFVWRAASAPAFDGKCTSGQLVIKPAPDLAEGFQSVTRLGQVDKVGEAYVMKDPAGAKYAVVEADEEAARLGVDKAGSFQQCRS